MQYTQDFALWASIRVPASALRFRFTFQFVYENASGFRMKYAAL